MTKSPRECSDQICMGSNCQCGTPVAMLGCGHTSELYAKGSFTFQAKNGLVIEVFCCQSCYEFMEKLIGLGIMELQGGL